MTRQPKESRLERLKHFLGNARHFITYAPKEGDNLMESYREALDNVRPGMEDLLGTDFSDVRVRKGGVFSSYHNLLKKIDSEMTNDFSRGKKIATLPPRVVGESVGGAIFFPLWSFGFMCEDKITV